MEEYELVALYHPDLEIDLEKALKKVEKIIKDNKGTITKQDSWGKRKLAYPIHKEDHAIYVYYELELEPTSLAKIESTLNITDEVLRYLIVKAEDYEEEEKDKDAKTKKAKEEVKAPSTGGEEGGEGDG